MSELPSAKRVRREELFESGSDAASSVGDDQDAVRAKLNARFSSLFSIDLEPVSSAQQTVVEDGIESDKGNQGAEEFEFRLFSRTGHSTQKVILPSREDELLANPDAGAFTKARPTSYYIRGELAAEDRGQIREAALSGRDVLEGARRRAWGLEKPWRVTKLTIPTAKRTSRPGNDESDATVVDEKRRRPGKKQRIAVRKRQSAKKEKAIKELQDKQAKEEHLQEKKKRLNREKKLKRRQKEREKKAATKSEASDGGGGGHESAVLSDAAD